MPLIRNSGTITVDHSTHPDIPEGEWYRLRKLLSWKQLDGLNKVKALKISAPNFLGARKAGQNERMDVQIDLVALHLEALNTYIVEWGFNDPIHYETLSEIDPKSKEVLVMVIDQLQDEQLGVKLDEPLKGNLIGYANGTQPENLLTD